MGLKKLRHYNRKRRFPAWNRQHRHGWKGHHEAEIQRRKRSKR